MLVVGIKELKNKLTYYLKLTKQGSKVIVTDRNKPVAVIRSIEKDDNINGIEDILASLANNGLIRLPLKEGALPKTDRIKIKGKPISKTIIDDRE